VLRGGAAERVLDTIEGASSELLVMGTQRKTLQSETIIGTTSERLLRYARVPVLSITRQAVPAAEEMLAAATT